MSGGTPDVTVQTGASARSSDADREYAWKYFALHADQRLKTFNFFVLLATLIIGGGLTLLKDESIPRAGASIGFFSLIFFAFVFWKLDQRNKELIRHGETALKFIEQDGSAHDCTAPDHVLQLFSHEEVRTDLRRNAASRRLVDPHLSFTQCFELVFIAVALIGVALGCVSASGIGRHSASPAATLLLPSASATNVSAESTAASAVGTDASPTTTP